MSNLQQNTALETFLTLGRWAMELLLWFFEVSEASIDPGLLSVGEFFLALLVWAIILRLLRTILVRILFRNPPRRG